MIPIQLSLRNFMCYRTDDDGKPLRLELDGLHVLCLSGENGAGKSTLLDAITWALWGEARSADDNLITQGETEMMVELMFDLDGRTYRVIRQRQRGRSTGKGTSAGKTWLDLQILDGTQWRPIGENTIRETQAKINALLRMSYRTFINASFLLQGQADKFTSVTATERKEVLAEILGLDEYAELEQRARERVRILDAETIRVRGQLESLQPTAAKVPFWQEAVINAEQQRLRLQAAYAELEAEYTVAVNRLRELEALAQRHRELLDRITSLHTDIQRYNRELHELAQRISHDESIIARRSVIQAGLAELTTARAELERLRQVRDQYNTLMMRRTELKQELKTAFYELRERLSRAEQERERLYTAVTRFAELQQRVATLQHRLYELAPAHARMAHLQDQRIAIEQQLSHLKELTYRQTVLKDQLDQRRVALKNEQDRLQQDRQRLDRQLADVARWRVALQEAQMALAALRALEEQQLLHRRREQEIVETLGKARAIAMQAQQAMDKLRANQALLATGSGECPVCRHRLDPAETEHVMAHYAHELAALQHEEARALATAQTAEQALATVRATIADNEQELDKLRRQAAAIETLERQLAQATAWEQERNDIVQRLTALEAKLATDEIDPPLQAELTAVTAQLTQFDHITGLQNDLAMINDELTACERQLREQSRLEGELDSCQRELERLQDASAKLPDVEAVVAELQRQIETNDFAHEIRSAGRQVEAEIAALNYQPELLEMAEAKVRSLAHWEQAERELILAEQRYAGELKLRSQTQTLLAHAERERQTLQAEVDTLANELTKLPLVQTTVTQIKQRLDETARALQIAERDLTEKQTYLRQAEAAAAQLETLQAQERQLCERSALFAELAEAFGKKGVQAMLIETAIPQIEDEANSLLARLTDGQMHLRFEMQRDTKKGDTVETLDVRVADALGTRDYKTFSGGEAMRVNFAIRIALSRLLAHRAGARLETLVIDEGFGTLDADGRERMVEAITAIQQDFARIIVITHIDDLKDRFPATLEIRKTPAGSRWELRG